MSTFLSDFVILHLSDLHIVSHKGDYSTALHKMIDHICGVTNDYKKIIIVVTGDIVEKGEFEKSAKTIKNFFEDIKNKLGEKIVDLVFTPGNHDKKRGVLNLPDSDKILEEKFWNDFKENDWQYFENQFEEYLKTTKAIREDIFKLSPAFDGTYGLHHVTLDNFNICFLCVNSSWSCMGDNESGKLRIGRFQLDDLKEQYQSSVKKQSYDLTIALMHHPTDWLTQVEQKYFNQYMIDEYRLNTNIILQGHIHEKEIYNWYNQNHSITTFVTGMGWDQQKELKDLGHRYSIYEINCHSKIARVNTYVSDSCGNFNEDTTVYRGNNLVFPLNVHKYLEINMLHFKDNEISCYFPDGNIVEDLSSLTTQLCDFVCIMHDILTKYQMAYENHLLIQRDILCKFKTLVFEENHKIHNMSKEELYNKLDFNDVQKHYSLSDEVSDAHITILDCIEKIRNHLISTCDLEENVNQEFSPSDYYHIIENFSSKQTEIYMKEKFLSFLGEFCLRIQAKIFSNRDFESGDTVRFHFRAMESKEVLKYRKIFSLTLSKDDLGKVNSIENADLTDIDYCGSLIEQSFEKNKTLLHSLNPSGNNHEKKDCWLDFITIATSNDFNTRKIEKDDEIMRYPYITFGVTVNNFKFQEKIRLLSYIGFEKIFEKLFTKFFKAIPYDLEKITSTNRG